MSDQGATDSFPRQYARTQRLTLGEPRNFVIAPGGERIGFLRSTGGSDPVNRLWTLDVETGVERLVADPVVLLAGDDEGDLPPEEKARRERAREGAGGITSWATDDRARTFVFTLAGRLFVGDLADGAARELVVPGPVFDPRVDPDGTRVAYVNGRALMVTSLDDGDTRQIAGPDIFPSLPDTVFWGAAEFAAAEELERMRGFWWSPDGSRLAVCEVDEEPVSIWHIADPAHPDRPAREHRYPAAGTDNAVVSLLVIPAEGGAPDRVEWNRERWPYLVRVQWDDDSALVVTVLDRDQREMRHFLAEASNDWNATREWTQQDPEWVDVVPGAPDTMGPETFITVEAREGWHRVCVNGEPVTPGGADALDVRSILAVDDEMGIVFAANRADSPHDLAVWAWEWREDQKCRCLTPEPGVHSVVVRDGTMVVRRAAIDLARAEFSVRRGDLVRSITSHAEVPLVEPRVNLRRYGSIGVPTAVLFPTGHVPGTKLPVLMNPYGGPHAQMVLNSRGAHCTSQWFADQGFAVVVADGRGTPGLGTGWEREVKWDLATKVLEDQVEALRAAAAEYPDLDTSRVGIRGWSFGGYLAALAVMRRPDVFHAAVAGAPVTEWRLYDTAYTERYLGNPAVDPAPYDATSLIPDAPKLSRPLLLVHGLADDNVVAAHTLLLSSALLAAGKPHEVLPLSGVTHMTPQVVVAENLLLHQLDFLRRSLG